MKFRLSTAAIVAVTLLSGLAAGIASPVFAEEAEHITLNPNNLSTVAKVPASTTSKITFASPTEVVQPIVASPAVLTDQDGDFATLDAAVAAQPAESADAELECLATTIYYESKGEPLSGQLAVAEVILNRAQSGRFPKSICSVVTQPGQFSFVKGGRLPEVDTGRRGWKVAMAVAQVAMKELWDSPADGALYFHARHLSPKWNRARVASVGNHVFYR